MPASITTGYPTRIEFFFQSVSMFFLHNDYKIYSASCCYYFFFFKVCFRIFLSRNEAAGKPLKCKKRHKERIERAVKHLIALR